MDSQRADFEAWALSHNPDLAEWPNVLFVKNGSDKYAIIRVQDAWEAWQARSALQSQDREDASRIQFMADEACAFNTWKQEDGSWKYRLEWDHGTEWQPQWFDSPEEAIDHARRIEGDGE